MTASDKLEANGVQYDAHKLVETARKYSVTKISVFGSSLSDRMSADSDIDLLVDFSENSSVSLFDLIDLETELSSLFGRPVDVVERESLTNPVRRRTILSSIESLYGD